MAYRNNHIIPNFILKYFRINGTNSSIYCLDKFTSSITQKNTNNRSHFFNLKDFYSKKKLNDLLQTNPNIELNPIFTFLDQTLEINLDRCIEDPFKKIIETAITHPINRFVLSEEEADFFKEYLCIQFIRTDRYKRDAKILNENLTIPSLMEIRKLVAKSAAAYGASNKINARSRETVTKEARLILMRLKASWEKPDSHSLEILSKQKRGSFYRILDLANKNISLLVNNTPLPFVLPDSGVVMMQDVPTEEVDRTTVEAYLPLTPKLCLKFSNDSMGLSKVDDSEIIQCINDVSFEESAKAIFSNDKAYLETRRNSPS